MKKLIAYNSKILPFIYLVATVLAGVCAISSISELEKYKILASIFFGIVVLVLFGAFVFTITNYKIAFEIINETLIIYKRRKVYTIDFHTIQKVKIGRNNIGFDCVVYYENDKKIGMHFLVKNFVKINKQFIEIINEMNIKTEFYSV